MPGGRRRLPDLLLIAVSERRPALEQALDVFVYAPVGLAVELQRVLPELAREGRTRVEQRVVLARFVGRLAVRTGRDRLERRLRPPTVTATDTGAAVTEAVVAGSAVATSTERSGTIDSPSVEDLAVPGYDSLSASQVVSRLAALTRDELDTIAAYEAAHRGRRTILGKIDQLRDRVA